MDAALQRLEMGRCKNMWEMYQHFWRPFGTLLTDMEKEGMMVNRWGRCSCERMPLTLPRRRGICIKLPNTCNFHLMLL